MRVDHDGAVRLPELWSPILGIAVGVGMLIASRRYIRDAEGFAASEETTPERRRYWSAVARGERLGQPVAWLLIVVSFGVFVLRMLRVVF